MGKRVKEWLEKMKPIVDLNPDNFSSLGSYIKSTCPYGEGYFCDGTTNKSVNRYGEDREACPKFIDGKCELSLHMKRGNGRSEI